MTELMSRVAAPVFNLIQQAFATNWLLGIMAVLGALVLSPILIVIGLVWFVVLAFTTGHYLLGILGVAVILILGGASSSETVKAGITRRPRGLRPEEGKRETLL